MIASNAGRTPDQGGERYDLDRPDSGSPSSIASRRYILSVGAAEQWHQPGGMAVTHVDEPIHLVVIFMLWTAKRAPGEVSLLQRSASRRLVLRLKESEW